ncbi:hypothetical protein MMC21_006164 [Puttea exsequens]|nr:hypothetical protein [Puttea exsequens]
MSHTQFIEPNNAPGHWTTLFGTDGAITKIVYSTYLLSVVTGALHFVSLIISTYLGVMFRKIAQLPPDLNPLEDNLTSRHKRNKSSLLNNRLSQATTATANSRQEDAKAADPLISPPRTVPFMHTRNDSHENIINIEHPKATPRVSKTDISAQFSDQPPAHRSSRTAIEGPFYEQASSNRSSRTAFKYQNSPPSHRASRADFQSIPLESTAVNQASPKRTSEPAINRSPTKSSSIYSTSTISTIVPSRPNSTQPRSIAPLLLDSNWITYPSTAPSPSPSPSPPRELRHLRNKSNYQALSQTSPFEYSSQNENLVPRPLEMNPPTPPIQQQKQRQAAQQRALTPGSGNVGMQGSWGTAQLGIGKARAWGGMGRTAGKVNGISVSGGGRVVSRSGVEVREGGILPSGGMRAREVSGKVMEEGRGARSWI